MTIDQIKAKIEASRDHVELRYLCDERLGMLCGSAEPTEEEVQITHDQLFKS